MAEAVAECKPVEAHGDYAEVLLAATGLVTDNDADMDADVISGNGVNPILCYRIDSQATPCRLYYLLLRLQTRRHFLQPYSMHRLIWQEKTCPVSSKLYPILQPLKR